MSSIRSTSSSTRIFISLRLMVRCSSRSSNRPGVAIKTSDRAWFLALFPVTDVIMHERGPQIGETTIIAKRRFNLRGELASRLQHQTSERAVFCEQRQDGKRKRCGLTGACLRGPDQILTGKDNWETRGAELALARQNPSPAFRASLQAKSKFIK